MERTLLNLLGRVVIVLTALITVVSLVDPAFAGKHVPAPILGAGLPALAILAGGSWLIRKLRERR